MPGFSDLSAVRAQKSRVRAAVLAKRRSTPIDVRTTADLRLASETRALIRSVNAVTVAAYVPFAREPGGTGLLDALAATGATVLLPVLLPDLDLDWAPNGGPVLGVGAVATADLVVVPALAVDRGGVRLGRGGGSYDRALARVRPSALVVALLYDGELVDELPVEPHDRRVGAVLLPGAGCVHLPEQTGRAPVG